MARGGPLPDKSAPAPTLSTPRLGELSKWLLTLSNLVGLLPVLCSVYGSDAALLTLAVT